MKTETTQDLIDTANEFKALITGEITQAGRFVTCNNINALLQAKGIKSKLVFCNITRQKEVIQHVIIELPNGEILDPYAMGMLYSEAAGMPGGVYIGATPTNYRLFRQTDTQADTLKTDEYYQSKVKRSR